MLTDLPENVPLLETNVRLNQCPSSTTKVVAFDWNQPQLPDEIASSPDFDVIIVSDCIYGGEAVWRPLLNALNTLTSSSSSSSSPSVLIAFELRPSTASRDVQFFRELKDRLGFTIQRVPNTQLDETYQAEDLWIMEAKRGGGGEKTNEHARIE